MCLAFMITTGNNRIIVFHAGSGGLESDEQEHEAGKSDTESQVGAAETRTTFQTRQFTQHSECQPNFRRQKLRLLRRLLAAPDQLSPSAASHLAN